MLPSRPLTSDIDLVGEPEPDRPLPGPHAMVDVPNVLLVSGEDAAAVFLSRAHEVEVPDGHDLVVLPLCEDGVLVAHTGLATMADDLAAAVDVLGPTCDDLLSGQTYLVAPGGLQPITLLHPRLDALVHEVRGAHYQTLFGMLEALPDDHPLHVDWLGRYGSLGDLGAGGVTRTTWSGSDALLADVQYVHVGSTLEDSSFWAMADLAAATGATLVDGLFPPVRRFEAGTPPAGGAPYDRFMDALVRIARERGDV